jgi:hypothetical protein
MIKGRAIMYASTKGQEWGIEEERGIDFPSR